MFMSLAVAAHQTCELECKAGVLGRPLLKHSCAQDLRTTQSVVIAAPIGTTGVAGDDQDRQTPMSSLVVVN
jgi:hypothetical protein